MIAPLIEQLSDELKNQIDFGVHDIESDPHQPVQYGVRGIPTLLLFRSGKLLDTRVGASGKEEIKKWLLAKI